MKLEAARAVLGGIQRSTERTIEDNALSSWEGVGGRRGRDRTLRRGKPEGAIPCDRRSFTRSDRDLASCAQVDRAAPKREDDPTERFLAHARGGIDDFATRGNLAAIGLRFHENLRAHDA